MRLFIPLLLITIFSLAPTITFAGDDPQPQILTKELATKAMQGFNGQVVSVEPTAIPGLFLVAMQAQGRIVPIYLDSTGSYLFSGNLIRLKDRKNLTEWYSHKLNPIDVSAIPIDAGMTLGNPEAKQQIFVFTDPHCPYCTKMHKVLHQAVAKNPDLAFHIKLIPFKASSKEITKTILCNKSMEQLEMAFAGQPVPAPTCETDAVEANLKLARKLGINGTPTSILPNGMLLNGYRDVDGLLLEIEKNRAETK